MTLIPAARTLAPPTIPSPEPKLSPSPNAELLLASKSPAMRAALNTLERAAKSTVPVLFRGESGTGKGVLARHLHACSARAGRPFVVVNCPVLSDELLSSELFGHCRGAFTGAARDKPGLVEAASEGTLFLDEIGDLPPALQVKLLRFVQDHEFERLGEVHTRTANVRIVAATNRDLELEVQQGRFRLDLYYRLSVVDIEVPPLRERPEDLSALIEHLLTHIAAAAGTPTPALDQTAWELLAGYSFPGNVRELFNELERALVLSGDAPLTRESFSRRLRNTAPLPPRVGDDITLEELERAHIERVVDRAASLDAAARILGIDVSTLWRKRRRFVAKAPNQRPRTVTGDRASCNAARETIVQVARRTPAMIIG